LHFIDVILPIPLKQTFTYNVTKAEASYLQPGMRVAVPFGKSKIYTGIVYQIHDKAPSGYDTKQIDQILDDAPIVTPAQFQHWQWMATYYMCTLGEVVKAALPSAFLLESETIVTLAKNSALDETVLTDDEFLVFEALQHQSSLHINDVRSILDRKNVVKIINQLLDKNIVTVQEEVYEQYTPKMKRFVKLHKKFREEDALRDLLDTLSNAPKQREVLMNLFMLTAGKEQQVLAKTLQDKSNTTSAVLKSLIEKGILEEVLLQRDRVQYSGADGAEVKSLSPAQEQALTEITHQFKSQDAVLLHGVTSSGKTEIYVQLISEMLESGRQVLYMLPEIALTTQLIKRLQFYFGEKVSVFHSKYSVNERVEVWNNVLHNKPKAHIVIGARSSLFLPYSDLGLIIVDEEHEPSFKQYNPAPRYWGISTMPRY